MAEVRGDLEHTRTALEALEALRPDLEAAQTQVAAQQEELAQLKGQLEDAQHKLEDAYSERKAQERKQAGIVRPMAVLARRRALESLPPSALTSTLFPL